MEIHHSAAPLTGLLLRGVVKVPRDEESTSLTGVNRAHFVFARTGFREALAETVGQGYPGRPDRLGRRREGIGVASELGGKIVVSGAGSGCRRVGIGALGNAESLSHPLARVQLTAGRGVSRMS